MSREELNLRIEDDEPFYVPEEYSRGRVDKDRYVSERGEHLTANQVRSVSEATLRFADVKEDDHYASDLLVEIGDTVVEERGGKATKGIRVTPLTTEGLAGEESLKVFLNNAGIWLDEDRQERGYFLPLVRE